ncbi:M20/M25/M40 family metallo-hydrolase [Microbispora sp. RL4-1S]|uniref:M20/M25/M40 family metallo-hydrolase n=1 Tax=Microbispora oryzae TaxID=2806554 RepID=A0A940WQJ6_9ACTN|nr:M20/M25/M40 family metallo-hydrolase [Microbispora oryzae]MBP2707737.1 M20/M25/M40 family metallo-hydrolase [Microbispora oryzae]
MLSGEALDGAVDALAEDAFAFLERLVAARSTIGHEAAACEVFGAELEASGFGVERLPIPPEIVADPLAGVRQVPYDGRANVLGTRGGNDGRSLLLNGHLDVVPAGTPEAWASPPFLPVRRDGRLYGRGSGDMKCGFAMGLLAVRALDEVAPGFDTGRLMFLGAIEEECTGNGTLSAARAGVLADAVVVLEPTDLGILTGGVGVLWLDLRVTGRAAHAQSAHLAVNPVDLCLTLVQGLRDWCAGLPQEVPDEAFAELDSPYNLNLGEISAGDWPSSVPTEALARIRVGFPRAWSPGEAERRVRAAIDDIVARDGRFPSAPEVTATGFRAAGYALSAGHPLSAAMARAHREAHGDDPREFVLGATTDARFYVNDFDVPALCYGPRAYDMHGVDESVDLRSIVDGAKTLARFLHRWFQPEVRG